MKKQKFPFNKALGWALALALAVLNMTPQAQSIRSLPENVTMVEGQAQSYSFFFPLKISVQGAAAQVLNDNGETLANLNARDITVTPAGSGSSVITLSLLGIPLKTMNVNVYEELVLVPGGGSVGVTLRTDGVLVVGMSPVVTKQGVEKNPAKDAGIQTGDSIMAVNGRRVATSDELMEALKSAYQLSSKVELTILRDGREQKTIAELAPDSTGAPKLGVWARDSTAGVGTVTYYDPSASMIGALGHPITDADTGSLLSVLSGSLYKASIVGVRMGQRGTPGELKGTFSGDGKTLAALVKNTNFGIFAKAQDALTSEIYPQGLPIGSRFSIKAGPATILATVDGEGVKEYSCDIQQLFKQDSISAKSMVIRITDPELLSKTGGIVQGMSGSPIIQDGHIVGAVTHVYVGDPTRGYGIYIEWMLEAQNS